MSNPGLILLSKAKAKSLRVQHLVVEDNIGESIHIHLNNMRIDLTIAEFLALAKQMRLATQELMGFGLPDFISIDPEYFNNLGQEIFNIQSIDHRTVGIESLKFAEDSNKPNATIPTFDTHDPLRLQHQLQGKVVIDGKSNVLYGSAVLARLKRQQYVGAVPVSTVTFKERALAKQPPTSHEVLILAGMSASGKTTLLKNTLLHQTPLFNEKGDQILRQFSLPSVFPENGLTLEERLTENTWVHEVDLVQMHVQNVSPRNLLVHFDLFWFLAMSPAWNQSMPRTAETEQFLALVRDRQALTQAFQVLTRLNSMAGANVVMKILKPPYKDICTWFLERERQKNSPTQTTHSRFLTDHVYNFSRSGEAIYDNIYAAWRQVFAKP